MKNAVIYRRGEKLIIGAQGKTTAGVLIGVGTPIVLDADIGSAEIGASLREALGRSRSQLRHPTPAEWPAITESFLRAVGAKSWGAFVRGAMLSTVEEDQAAILFQPYENCGPRDAFQPMGLPSITIPADASDQEIGDAAVRALEIARLAVLSEKG